MSKRTLICIVGMLPNQQAAMRHKVGIIPNAPELRFFDNRHSPQDLPLMPDYVLCSKHAGRQWWASAKDIVPKDRLFFMEGAVTRMMRKIYDIMHFVPPKAPTDNPAPAAATATADEPASTPPPAPESGRIYWDDAEIAKLADEFVIARVADPLAATSQILELAQEKALVPERRRVIPGIPSSKPLQAAILKAWSMFTQPAAPAPSEAAAPQPVPPAAEAIIQIIEVPRKLTAAEMLEQVDEAGLHGLLLAKQLQRENQFHQAMLSLASKAGGTTAPVIPPYVPKMDAFATARKAAPRIAVLGLPEEYHTELLSQLYAAKLPAVLRFPSTKDRLAVEACDFAVVCRNGSATASITDRTIGQLGRDHVCLMEGHETAAVLQQIRNITTRQ